MRRDSSGDIVSLRLAFSVSRPGSPAMAEPSFPRESAALIEIIGSDARQSRGGPAQWADDLTPIAPADWSFDRAGHLLERAGFGGTPAEIARLAAMTPQDAVAALLDYRA